MDRDVKFRIRLNIDGKESVAAASADVRKLADEVEAARTNSTKLRDALIKATQIGTSFQNITTGLQQLTGLMRTYTTANATQVEAETKLANNMRNTMAARQEDIESIKKLCSAQQELGVIGDEVQLAGAQELTTYLEKKSSLEKLIPVMNDMLAQQYGLNATSEEAQNIATMLGKVMDGQVGALSRYGYKFDEAQEQVLKFGTEEERAAVLAEVVESAVGGMNAELAKTNAGKAKQMANAIGDMKEQVGALFTAIEPTVIAVGELGMAMGAIGTTVNGIQGVCIGVKNLTGAVKGGTAATLAHGAASKVAAAAQSLWTMQMRYGRQASIAFAFGAKTAAAQALAMRAAILGLMAATGVGAALAVVAGIVSLFAGRTDEAAESLKASNREMKRAEDEARRLESLQLAVSSAYTNASSALEIHKQKLQGLIEAKKTGKDVTEEEKKLVGELNDTYGQTMGYFGNVAKWYEALVANSKAYCRQMVLEAQTRELADQIGAKEAENRSIVYDEKGNARKYSTARQQKWVTTGYGTGGYQQGEYQDIAGSSDAEKALQQYRDNLDVINDLKKRMEASVKELGEVSFSIMGSGTRGEGSPDAEVKGILNQYTKRLAELKKEIDEATSEADATAAVERYNALEKELKEYKIRIGLEKPDKQETETYVETLRGQLAAEQEKLNAAVDVEARVKAAAEIDRIQAEIDEATKGKVSIKADVEPAYILEGSREDKRQSYSNAQSRASRIQMDYDIGLIGADEAQRQIEELNAEVANLDDKLKPFKLEIDTTEIKKADKSFKKVYGSIRGVGDGIQGITSALEGNGNAWQKITSVVDGFIQIYEGVNSIISIIGLLTSATTGQTVAETAKGAAASTSMGAEAAASANNEVAAASLIPLIAANKLATASYMELAAASYFAAHAYIPFAGFGIALGFASSAVAAVETIAAMPFADGGVVYGPTLGLMGEYSGAANNPEVVAPLDKLKKLIGETDGGQTDGKVEFRIRNRTLWGALERENRRRRRS